jgi:IS1 family transposase
MQSTNGRVKHHFMRFRRAGAIFSKAFMATNYLGGIIEIDEAMITSKRRGLIGRVPNSQLWVFGLYSRSSDLFFVFLIPNRRSQTLMGIIDQIVAPNSEIISDEFRTYVSTNRTSRITQLLPYKNLTHFWVNHSISFINPLWPEIHTKNIERMWSCMRKKVRRNFTLEHLEDWINYFLFEKFVCKGLRYQTLLVTIAKYDCML